MCFARPPTFVPEPEMSKEGMFISGLCVCIGVCAQGYFSEGFCLCRPISNWESAVEKLCGSQSRSRSSARGGRCVSSAPQAGGLCGMLLGTEERGRVQLLCLPRGCASSETSLVER